MLWLGSTTRNLWDDVPCSFSEPLLYLTVFVCLFVCLGRGESGEEGIASVWGAFLGEEFDHLESERAQSI